MVDKEKLIKQSLNKYKKLYKDIDGNKHKIIEKLYAEAAFIEADLAELKEIINEKCSVCDMINGNGVKVTQEHPAKKSYNATVKNYCAIIKTLAELVPEVEVNDEL